MILQRGGEDNEIGGFCQPVMGRRGTASNFLADTDSSSGGQIRTGTVTVHGTLSVSKSLSQRLQKGTVSVTASGSVSKAQPQGTKNGTETVTAVSTVVGYARKYLYGSKSVSCTAAVTITTSPIKAGHVVVTATSSVSTATARAIRTVRVSLTGSATTSLVTEGVKYGTGTAPGVTSSIISAVIAEVYFTSATVYSTASVSARGTSSLLTASVYVMSAATIVVHGAATPGQGGGGGGQSGDYGLLRFSCNNINASGYLAIDSLEIDSQVNTRDTLRATLNVPAGSADIPRVGYVVEMYNGTVILFSGTIENVVKTTDGESGIIRCAITAVDYNQLCDRYLVTKVYVGWTLGAIVRDIVTTKLAVNGVSSGGVEEGPTIEKAVFNYKTVNECFNGLADLTGYVWWIDYGKVLNFVSRSSRVAPVDVTGGVNAHVQNFTAESTRQAYRNTQYVPISHNLTDARTECFLGDGQNQTFTLAYPVGQRPESVFIWVPNVSLQAQTIGVRGKDTGKDFYWAIDTQEISQDETASPLTPLEVLKVTYRGTYPSVLKQTLPSEIASIQSMEGGDGVYEAIDADTAIETAAAGNEYALGLLRKYGDFPDKVSFTTSINGFQAGQVVTVNMPRFGVNDSYFITNVTLHDVSGMYLLYDVQAVSGEGFASWVEYYKKLAGVETALLTRQYLLNDSDVVTDAVGLPPDTITVLDGAVTATSVSGDPYVGLVSVNQSELAS
jgi:hypothetical protein